MDLTKCASTGVPF